MVRALHVARRSALKARTQAANQLHALLVSAPEEIKAELRGLSTDKLWSPPRRASVRAAFPKICGPRPSWR